MNRRDNANFEELEELLWRAEKVLQDPPEEPESPEFYDTYELPAEEDYAEYELPAEDDGEPDLYRNYANGYGSEYAQQPQAPRPAQPHASHTVRPEYPHASRPVQPEYPRTPRPVQQERPVRPAPQHHAYQDPYDDWDDDDGYGVPPKRTAAPNHSSRKVHQHRRRRGCGCGCGCLTPLLLLVIAIVAAWFLLFKPPISADAIGPRKDDTATILICGTDKDGTRTDTMMLLYLSGSEKQVSLLSLPRDSYTITSSGKAAKLNSAFGRGGTGEEGMENLLDYVQDIIGYRPDGYVLVDFTLVPQIVDIMGGVDVEVPMDMKVDGVSLEAGFQHLDGRQTLTLLRFRKGYAMADLKRVEVQRTVLKACIEQWVSPDHIADAMEAISLVESGSISSLTTSNYAWVAKTLLTGMDSFRNDTLPGYPDYRGSASYYILNKSDIAELVNEFYNPYKTVIDPDDLNIAG